VASQKWNSPTSAASPPPWVLKQAPPSWFKERAEEEGCPPESVEAWRTELVELGVGEVRLTSDVRGVTIDFDGAAPQNVNDDNAKPLSSAIGRGLDRLRMKQKSDEGNRVRRATQHLPQED
jgi:hypothetical protein